MKKASLSLLLLFLLASSLLVNAQNELLRSHINNSVGGGMNYGGLGVKRVNGYRNRPAFERQVLAAVTTITISRAGAFVRDRACTLVSFISWLFCKRTAIPVN